MDTEVKVSPCFLIVDISKPALHIYHSFAEAHLWHQLLTPPLLTLLLLFKSCVATALDYSFNSTSQLNSPAIFLGLFHRFNPHLLILLTTTRSQQG